MEREVIEKARGINLPAFIECVSGQTPQRKRANGMFYFSPFRTENVPSLHVSFKNGLWLWYDHGSAEHMGGDAIEFVRNLKDCSFNEAIEILLDFDGHELTPGRRTSRKDSVRYEQHTRYSHSNSAKLRKIFRVREFYDRLSDNYTTTMKKYFTDRGLRFHEEIGCKVHFHFIDKVRYIVFPLPYQKNMRGLELKEICSLEKDLGLIDERKKRKNYGTKTLWLFKRNASRLLVTESIVDALAGEIILDDYNISLAALNGVGQVSQLDQMMKALKPKKVLLSIDKDIAGEEATRIAKQILLKNRVVHEVLKIKQKDLFRELHSTKMKEVNQHAGNTG